jgi:hypothetical protein
MRKKARWTAIVAVFLLMISMLPAAWAQRDRVYRQPPQLVSAGNEVEIFEGAVPLGGTPQAGLEGWLWNGFVWLGISLAGAGAAYRIQKKKEERDQ